VVPTERIVVGVTREPAHQQRVVVCLGQYSERAVLGVVPVAGAILLQVDPQLVAVVGCPGSLAQYRKMAVKRVFVCAQVYFTKSTAPIRSAMDRLWVQNQNRDCFVLQYIPASTTEHKNFLPHNN